MSHSVNLHRKLNQIVPVPEGLRELMADIAREVLRYQPTNVERFIADYLDSMLLTRELFIVAHQTVDDVLDATLQIIELLQRDGFSMSQADKAVKVIREEFQSHCNEIREQEPLKELNIIHRLVNECNLTVDQARKASDVIESAWCYYYRRNKSHSYASIIPEVAQLDAVKNTLAVYQKAKASCSDVRKTEKVLQATFGGYLKRKSRRSDENLGANWKAPNFQQREQAALAIQSWYRGVRFRSHYKQMLQAAKVIQAAYKGYQHRKAMKQEEEEKNQPQHEAARVIQSCFRALKARQELECEREKAATAVQSHVRGFLVRKKLKAMNWGWKIIREIERKWDLPPGTNKYLLMRSKT